MNSPVSQREDAAFDVWAHAREAVQSIYGPFRYCVPIKIFLGFELVAIHRELCVQRGGDRRGKTPATGPKWQEAITANLGISDDSARMFMWLAEAVAPKIKLHNGSDAASVLGDSVERWSDDVIQSVFHGLKRLTEGKTMSGLLKEHGSTRRRLRQSAESTGR
jgi:hypothetical protein